MRRPRPTVEHLSPAAERPQPESLKPLSELTPERFQTLAEQAYGRGRGPIAQFWLRNGHEAIVVPGEEPGRYVLIYDRKTNAERKDRTTLKSDPLAYEFENEQLQRGLTRIGMVEGGKKRVTHGKREASEGERYEAFRVLAEAAGCSPEEVATYRR